MKEKHEISAGHIKNSLSQSNRGGSKKGGRNQGLKTFGMGAGLHLLECFLNSLPKYTGMDTQAHTQINCILLFSVT